MASVDSARVPELGEAMARGIGRACSRLKLRAELRSEMLACGGFRRQLVALLAHGAGRGDVGAVEAAAFTLAAGYSVALLDVKVNRAACARSKVTADDLAEYYMAQIPDGRATLAAAGLGAGWAVADHPPALLDAVAAAVESKLSALPA